VSAARELRIISSADSDLALSVLGMLSGTSVIAFDCDLRVTLISGEAFASDIASPREMEGQQVKSVLDEDRLAVYEPLFRAAVRGESKTLEIWSEDE